jgi:Arc/MetJ-type ribon-helix-helix transcriptional regulator
MPLEIQPMGEKKDQRIPVMMSSEEVEAIDDWRRQRPDLPSRSEAIRRLVEVGLTVKTAGPRKYQDAKRGKDTKRRAGELAGAAIDRMAEAAASPEDQASRKRRLIKGPEEFQKVRRDRSEN